MYNKSSKTAVSVMTCLAEIFDAGATRLSSGEIAKIRNLQRPIVAKTLTILSQIGVIKGTPGPGGGYWLARPPADICIFEVSNVFERSDRHVICPFGGGVCGDDAPCPLHEDYTKALDGIDNFLKDTTFQVFRDAYLNKQDKA